MVNLWGPGAFFCARPSATRPELTPENGAGDPDDWLKDCSSIEARDGTELRAGLLNALLAQMRGVARKSGVAVSNLDDDLLTRAIRRGFNYGVCGGSADALTLTLDPVPLVDGEVAAGFEVLVAISTINATSAPTFKLNTLAAAPIVKQSGAAPAPGDITGYVPLLFDGTNWRVNGLCPSDVPKVATGDVTLYVRTDGNDTTGDGSANTAGKAFATIAAAITYGLARFNLGSYKLIIQLGNAGTYAPPGVIRGAPTIRIVGDAANQGNYNISGAGPGGGGSALLLSAAREVEVVGVTLTNTSNINHTTGAISGGSISYTNVTFATSGGLTTFAVFTGIGGIITVNSGCIISAGTYNAAISLSNNAQFGLVGVLTITGTPAFNTAFALMNSCATFQAYGGSFSGAATGTRYTVSTNAVANTNGGGASYFPGSGAGATATGGQYL